MSPIETEAIQHSFRLAEYGVLGIFCVFLIGGIIFLFLSNKKERENTHKCHAQERKDWKATTEKQFADSKEMSEKVNENIGKLDKTLSEIKVVIHSNKR